MKIKVTMYIAVTWLPSGWRVSSLGPDRGHREGREGVYWYVRGRRNGFFHNMLISEVT